MMKNAVIPDLIRDPHDEKRCHPGPDPGSNMMNKQWILRLRAE
jgi:hypothetical protein